MSVPDPLELIAPAQSWLRYSCCWSTMQMEVSLVVRNHKLQYDPPLEELRMQHLTQHLQPFLALPLRMKGVSSLSERAGFFGAIAHAYPAATAKVCSHALPLL